MTLEELLRSRDERAALQRKLLAAYPGCSLVCLTVQLPGEIKRNADSLLIGGAGVAALLDRFGSVLRHVQVRDLQTGYEAYLLLPLPERLVKQNCCAIEAAHPLGRLMDMDVFGQDGIPVSRQEVGEEPRRCLLCEREVRLCMRSQTHSREELLREIHRRVENYANL